MKEFKKQLSQKLNDSKLVCHFSITGGGARFLGEYMEFGGASKTIVGAEVPYHFSSLDSFLGASPFGKYCSKETARQMASRSHSIARDSKLNDENTTPVGVGVCCSLTTGKTERQGRENKAFVCLHSHELTEEFEINFHGISLKSREKQEEMTSDYIFASILTFMKNHPMDIGFESRMENEILSYLNKVVPQISLGFASSKRVNDTVENCLKRLKNKEDLVVLSGSFNPFHEGHEDVFGFCKNFADEKDKSLLIEVTSKAYGKDYVDNISLKNRIEDIIVKTGHTFVGYSPLTLFVDKANHYLSLGCKKVTFAIGYDTYERVFEYDYKEGSCEAFFKSKGISQDQMSFLVFPREEKHFDAEKSSPYVDPESCFLKTENHHISSTKIREENKKR